MATPRKHWFRVADSLTHEAFSNDELATLIRLMGHLNQRWARDGLTAEEACTITLRAGDLMSCCGARSLVKSRKILQTLTKLVTFTVETKSRYTTIFWPKWSEFQQLHTPTRGKVRAEASLSAPAPAPAPAENPHRSPSKPTAQQPQGPRKPSPVERARAVWPDLVQAANRSGGAWREKPGKAQLQIVAARISDGATESDLLDAVVGYIRRHGTDAHDGFDPMASFTATSIFRPSKIDANIQFASQPARNSQPSKPTTAQVKQDALHDSARGALELFQKREASKAKELGDGQ